jgi:hypothetical protein
LFIEKIGMVLRVPWQIVPIHVSMVVHALHQTLVHVHHNGEINIICHKLSLNCLIVFIGADQLARCLSVLHLAKIVEHVQHQMFVLGKYSYLFSFTFCEFVLVQVHGMALFVKRVREFFL